MPTLDLPAPVAIVEKLGDTLEITLEFQDSTGAARDKSTSTFTGQIRTAPEASTTFASFTVDTSSASSGLVVFTVAKATTATATVGQAYHFDLVETPSGGTQEFTRAHGTITWKRRVTR